LLAVDPSCELGALEPAWLCPTASRCVGAVLREAPPRTMSAQATSTAVSAAVILRGAVLVGIDEV
jgi:hypothetical protein